MKIPFIRPVVPPHVFCLLGDGVTYASVRRDPPRGFSHARHFPYPARTVGAGPAGTPLFTREAIAEAVEAGRRLSQGRLTRASVVFPDSWARILPIDFDSLPESETAAREMVVWKLKKLLPGVTAELSVVFREMTPSGEEKRLLVAAAPAETLRSVEQAFESAGVRVGLLAPASLVLFEGLSGTLSARSAGDYAIVHLAPDSFVLVVARNGSPMLFRQRPSEEAGDDHDQEVRLSLSYYAEKLNGSGLSAVYVHGPNVGERLGRDVFPVEPQPFSARILGANGSFDERIGARPELLSAFAAVSERR